MSGGKGGILSFNRQPGKKLLTVLVYTHIPFLSVVTTDQTGSFPETKKTKKNVKNVFTRRKREMGVQTMSSNPYFTLLSTH